MSTERTQAIPDLFTSEMTTESLHPIIGAAPIAIVAIDSDGKIIYVNQKLEELFGYSESEMLNNEVEMLMPGQFHAVHRQHRQNYIENPHTRAMGSGMDLVGRHKDGGTFPLEAGLSTVRFADRKIVIASIIDITVRKQNEEELEQRVVERTAELERRRRVADALRDVLAVTNQERSLEQSLDYIVRQAGMLLGADGCAVFHADKDENSLYLQNSYGLPPEYASIEERELSSDEPIGRSIIESMSQTAPNLSGLSEAPAYVNSGGANYFALLHTNGIKSLMSLPLYVQGEIYGALALFYKQHHDFSDENIDLGVTYADQAGLVIENAHLRSQAEEAAVAEERSRIARDLHDSVTQTLFAATIIADVLPRLWERKPEQGLQRLQELHQLNRGALAEMRTMLLELRPTMLDNADLGEVMEYLVAATSNRARVPVNLTIEGDASQLPNEVRVALYRVAQEALNNVFKHANASKASVELHIEPDDAQLTVTDDGSGFEAQEVAGNHVGLRIMHERVGEIGAKLTITSEPDAGTQINVLWQKE